MNQYKDKTQIKSFIKQAYLINQILDEYGFTSILDIGTGPGIIKRVLVKQGKVCHTIEQHRPWEEFTIFKPQIDYRMGYYKDRSWELPSLRKRYDCIVLARFFDIYHTNDDIESIIATLKAIYESHILILQNPKSWQLNTYIQKKAKRHNTTLWPIYVIS